MSTNNAARRTATDRFLDIVETVGNKLPHPATLFLLLAAGVVLLSGILSTIGLTAVHPGTGKTIEVVNLLSGEGLRRIVTSLVTNFTLFAPLGTVLVALLGIGIAEGSGLLGTAIRALVLSAPKRLITAVVVFAGVLSNAAGEAGYVILIPLGATIFAAFGRHPLAGLAAGFAGVSGGYSANILLGTVDPLLAGISTEAAHILDPGYVVNPAANYYFMAASTFLITLLGTLVTERIVEPRLGTYHGAGSTLEPLSADERRGLRVAGYALAVVVVVLLWTLIPEDGILRDPKTGSILHSPFLSGIVAILFIVSLVPGIAYGWATKSMKNDADVVNAMSKTMSTMGSYIVLVFFAAQFVAFFNWTHIGMIVAIDGAHGLKSIGLTGVPLIVSFIVISATINLAMGSASAKWAIMAPVFVPMFMLLGYSPELTQTMYRVGDSVTNVITPMMTYFALIITFVQKYRPNAGIGTLISMMMPYSFAFFIGWTLFLLAWLALGIPVGPGAPLAYPAE
ncbi:MAG: AbgT family transporter [Bacteroidetes bacterium]|jgi:aminobenzoyl-glutamate transport protein|nr:AbgT family transporter [Bacteroidota bacterium]